MFEIYITYWDLKLHTIWKGCVTIRKMKKWLHSLLGHVSLTGSYWAIFDAIYHWIHLDLLISNICPLKNVPTRCPNKEFCIAQQ